MLGFLHISSCASLHRFYFVNFFLNWACWWFHVNFWPREAGRVETDTGL